MAEGQLSGACVLGREAPSPSPTDPCARPGDALEITPEARSSACVPHVRSYESRAGGKPRTIDEIIACVEEGGGARTSDLCVAARPFESL